MGEYLAKWHRELYIFQKIKPLIILEGNILDVYSYPVDDGMKGSILRLPEYLHYFLRYCGYETIAFYDGMTGFFNTCEPRQADSLAKLTGVRVQGDVIKSDFKGKGENAAVITRRALEQNESPLAIVMDLASRYITSPDSLDKDETDSYTNLLLASMNAKEVKTENGLVRNLLIMVVNKLNDIPAWLYLDNPNVKTLTIGTPTSQERELLVKGDNFASFFTKDIFAKDYPFYSDKRDELSKIQDKFVALTEGFSFTELNNLRRLCKNEQIRIANMCDVIDIYKYGIRDNPWKSLKTEELKSAETHFNKRVKGQDAAITKCLDIVKRAVTGLSGLQHSSHGKPKGILFFAGPTGTGKTETAKTLAEILFGSEKSCICFDMSEYGQSHSDQKLLGAPPGYVGYEAGGQLTNAVRNNPFSILLFDEIEKAHGSIFDKFLQILEDGRMTDGQGNTVYFSETIIIFTSNLGIFTKGQYGNREANVTQDMDYPTVQKRVRAAIEDYFKLELGRPEILNRIGENIVVFDFIRTPVAESILDHQIQKIADALLVDKEIKLIISKAARKVLLDACLGNLSNGGRGIGNVVESLLINPLSRYLFDNSVSDGETLFIAKIDADSTPATIKCGNELV